MGLLRDLKLKGKNNIFSKKGIISKGAKAVAPIAKGAAKITAKKGPGALKAVYKKTIGKGSIAGRTFGIAERTALGPAKIFESIADNMPYIAAAGIALGGSFMLVKASR